MPTITKSTTVAANDVSGNILSGELYEFLPSPAGVAVYSSAAADGINAMMSIGGEVLINDNLVSNSNRFPVVPDDQILEEGGFQGDRLFLQYRNTTGAPVVVKTLIDITPVG